MMETTEKIRELAAQLLRDKKVEAVLGFREGSLPMTTRPFVARTPEKARMLVWNSHCRLNLANYTSRLKGRIAVTAKGCDSRSLAVSITEGRIRREDLYVIGIPCQGMLDPAKAEASAGSETVETVEVKEVVRIRTRLETVTVPRAEILRDNCLSCTRKNPVIADTTLGSPVDEAPILASYPGVNALEALDPASRDRRFNELLSGCIRCYACRNACFLCYCPRCFVDESDPQWLGKGTGITDIRSFHILRAFHMAGRCTDCGACETACPMGIKLRLLTLKLEKDCLENFQWEPGLSTTTRPALDVFDPRDPEPFIL